MSLVGVKHSQQTKKRIQPLRLSVLDVRYTGQEIETPRT
jgi:hypothetical protein